MNIRIDFDEWVKIARENPQEFERKRRELINNFIVSAPPEQQKKLRELQVIIDAERAMSGTPLEACQRISAMMMEEVEKEGGLSDIYGKASLLLEDLKSLKNNSSKVKRAAEEFHDAAKNLQDKDSFQKGEGQ
jgi:hypothetical protein